MNGTARRSTAVVAAMMAAVCLGAAIAQQQDDAADASRLVEVLRLRAGSVVADIGAGGGELTLLLAGRVGPKGHVYATDINPERLREIRAAVAAAALVNVTVIEGGSSRTNLPDVCCDAIFMRHVYHHLGDPAAMNGSVRRSLKPGGRLAVIDFAPDTGRSAPAGRRDTGDAHGVMSETIIGELSAAGFVEAEQLPWPSPGYFVVAATRP